MGGRIDGMSKRLLIGGILLVALVVGGGKLYCIDLSTYIVAKSIPKIEGFEVTSVASDSGRCNPFSSGGSPDSTVYGESSVKPPEFFSNFDEAITSEGWTISRRSLLTDGSGTVSPDGAGVHRYDKGKYYLSATARGDGTTYLRVGKTADSPTPSGSVDIPEHLQNLTSEKLDSYGDFLEPAFLPSAVDVWSRKTDLEYDQDPVSGEVSIVYSCTIDPAFWGRELPPEVPRGLLGPELTITRHAGIITTSGLEHRCKLDKAGTATDVTLTDGTQAIVTVQGSHCGSSLWWNVGAHSYEVQVRRNCPVTPEELVEIASSVPIHE